MKYNAGWNTLYFWNTRIGKGFVASFNCNFSLICFKFSFWIFFKFGGKHAHHLVSAYSELYVITDITFYSNLYSD